MSDKEEDEDEEEPIKPFCCDKFEQIYDEENIYQKDKSIFKFSLVFANDKLTNTFNEDFQYCPFCGSDTKTWHKEHELTLYEIEAVEAYKNGDMETRAIPIDEYLKELEEL